MGNWWIEQGQGGLDFSRLGFCTHVVIKIKDHFYQLK